MARHPPPEDDRGLLAKLTAFFTSVAGLITAVTAVVTASVSLIGFFLARDGGADSTSATNPLVERFEIEVGDSISEGVPEDGAGMLEQPGAQDVSSSRLALDSRSSSISRRSKVIARRATSSHGD